MLKDRSKDIEVKIKRKIEAKAACAETTAEMTRWRVLDDRYKAINSLRRVRRRDAVVS